MQHQLHLILPYRVHNNIPQFRLQVNFGPKIFHNESCYFKNQPEITPIWIKHWNYRTIFCQFFGHYHFKCNEQVTIKKKKNKPKPPSAYASVHAQRTRATWKSSQSRMNQNKIESKYENFIWCLKTCFVLVMVNSFRYKAHK